MKNFLTILDLQKAEAAQLVQRAAEMKKSDYRSDLLAGKTILLIFEKASTRTRLSFEMAVNHLGGNTIFMTPAESQLGRSEPLKDTARVVSRYVSGLVVRTFGQSKLDELIRFGSIPVVNALTNEFHPCQVMSDMLTMSEHSKLELSQLSVAWIGDGNNMAHSWINASALFGFELKLACPQGYEPDKDIMDRASQLGARLSLSDDPCQAVQGVHFVNTDVWASMGQEEEQRKREEAFAGYIVDDELLALAHAEVNVMHCLPAHRGEEITEQVIEGERSIVWDQAENRMHMQKAILEWVFK